MFCAAVFGRSVPSLLLTLITANLPSPAALVAHAAEIIDPRSWFLTQPGGGAAPLPTAFSPFWALGVVILVRNSLRSDLARSLLALLPVAAACATVGGFGTDEYVPVAFLHLAVCAIGFVRAVGWCEQLLNQPLTVTAAVQWGVFLLALNFRLGLVESHTLVEVSEIEDSPFLELTE